MYNPAIQTAASALGLGKSATLISYSPLALPDVSPHWFSKPDIVGLLFPVQVSQAGAQAHCFPGGHL